MKGSGRAAPSKQRSWLRGLAAARSGRPRYSEVRRRGFAAAVGCKILPTFVSNLDRVCAGVFHVFARYKRALNLYITYAKFEPGRRVTNRYFVSRHRDSHLIYSFYPQIWLFSFFTSKVRALNKPKLRILLRE